MHVKKPLCNLTARIMCLAILWSQHELDRNLRCFQIDSFSHFSNLVSGPPKLTDSAEILRAARVYHEVSK